MLRLFRLVQVSEEVSHVVAGLVAMGVFADEAGHIDNVIGEFKGLVGEEGVKRGLRFLPAAHQLLEILYIVRNEEAELPGNGLGEIVRLHERVERLRSSSSARSTRDSPSS